MSPDPMKVRDIQTAPAPSTVSGVRSFMEMMNYCGRFIRNLTDLTAPLRELTKSNVTWDWGPEQECAF